MTVVEIELRKTKGKCPGREKKHKFLILRMKFLFF